MPLNYRHRLLHDDDGVHCFACGLVAPDRTSASSWPCGGPTTAHPPVLLGMTDDCQPIVETCAAHPYQDCRTGRAERPDGDRPDADRWIEALLGARLRFHHSAPVAGTIGDVGARREADIAIAIYKRWSQLYSGIYARAHV